MAIIINKASESEGDSGLVFLLGIIIIMILGYITFIYALPYIGDTLLPTQVSGQEGF